MSSAFYITTNKLSNSPSEGRCSDLRSAARSDRGATPGDEVDHERDNSADQQNVDEKSCCMKRKEAPRPQQKQKNTDSNPHCTRSSRPDVHRSFNRRLEEAASCLRFQSYLGRVNLFETAGGITAYGGNCWNVIQPVVVHILMGW